MDGHPLPTPRKVVPYPIAAAPNGGALFLFGPPDAPNVALLCGGFPDDHELFLPFAAKLASEAQCLVGVACLPGYDDREDFPYTRHKNEGYTFDEMASALREAAKALRNESTHEKKGGGGAAKFTAIFHDWGVPPGLIFSNRCIEEGNAALRPDRIVLFDVLTGPHPKTKDKPVPPKSTIYETVCTLTYRIVLATSFGIRRHVSKTLAQICLGLGSLSFNLLGLAPTKAIDSKVFSMRQRPIGLDRMIYMAYPYYNMFKAFFGGRQSMERAFYGACLPKDLTMTPVLYMYGTEKNVMFHDKSALMLLEREADEGHKSRAMAVEGAGHWLYVQKPDICMEEVVRFMEDA